MEADLSLEFLRVVEQAAIACAHTMGLGDGKRSDHAAVEAMRRELDRVPIDGCIVIGEGERDEARGPGERLEGQRPRRAGAAAD
jgi:fructose-1,6-bisphosphatase/sedoheptulose 1,7-bisphosphatase-like protein